MLFKNPTEQDIWIEKNCDRCYRSSKKTGQPCPILMRALASGRKPPEWDRMPRAQTIDTKIRCNARQVKAPTRPKEDVSMFDDEFIPVTSRKDVDHA
jgi:hypothetical protein